MYSMLFQSTFSYETHTMPLKVDRAQLTREQRFQEKTWLLVFATQGLHVRNYDLYVRAGPRCTRTGHNFWFQQMQLLLHSTSSGVWSSTKTNIIIAVGATITRIIVRLPDSTRCPSMLTLTDQYILSDIICA